MSSVMTKPVDIDANGVGRLVIEGAGPLNVINGSVARDVASAARELAGTQGVRVVVVCSNTERAFIGGADMREMASLRGPEEARHFITALHEMCEAIRDLPAPSVCAISSWCIGVGLELAAACDLRIAADSAQLAMPEVKLGIPSVIHAALLSRLIGEGRARWLMLTGETIGAKQAERWGLVERVVPRESFKVEVDKLALSLAQLSPSALRAQKRVLRASEAPHLDSAMQHSIELFGVAYESNDPQRLMQDFLDKHSKATKPKP